MGERCWERALARVALATTERRFSVADSSSHIRPSSEYEGRGCVALKRFFTNIALGFSALLVLSIAATGARADIIYIPGPIPPAGGVGHTPESILSIQSPRNTDNAFGSVSWNGRKDVIAGEIAKKGEHSKTLSFAEAGLASAGQLRIFMDIEDPDNDLILHELVLTAYGTSGNTLFQASYRQGPALFVENGHGQGHGDYVFGLTPDQAALLQAQYQANPNLRLGLYARSSDDTGSFTNFKLGQGPAKAPGPAPVPEPTTMLLLGTGLAGVAAKLRRRRKGQQDQQPE